jgi:hypothetical protein
LTTDIESDLIRTGTTVGQVGGNKKSKARKYCRFWHLRASALSGGEGGIRSGRFSQMPDAQQFAPKVFQRGSLGSFRSVLVVCGCLAIFGVIFSTDLAQSNALTRTSSTIVTTALRSLPWSVLSAATSLPLNRISELGWLPWSPVFTRNRISRPARIRKKNWAGDPSFGGRVFMMLSGVMAATAIIPGLSLPESGRRVGPIMPTASGCRMKR